MSLILYAINKIVETHAIVSGNFFIYGLRLYLRILN